MSMKVRSLAVGEQVRAVLPLGDDAEAGPVVSLRPISASWTLARCAGRPSESAASIPSSSVRTDSWRGRTPMGSASIRRDARGVDDPLKASIAGGVHGDPPSSASISASESAGSQAAMSPRRWEQRTPAAAMNA